MNILKKIYQIPQNYYYFFFIIISLILFFLTEKIYKFDLDVTNEQDARYYIQIAQNPFLFFDLKPFYSSRLLSPLLVFFISKLTGLNIYYSFKILVSVAFTLLNFNLFNFFKNKTNYLNSFLLILMLNFSNWVLLYNFFNPYQLLDLLTILISINLVIATLYANKFKMIIYSIFSILNKHYMVLLIVLCYLHSFIKKRENYYLYTMFVLIIIFIFFHMFSGINFISDSNENNNIFEILLARTLNTIIYFPQNIKSFLIDNNLPVLMPFIFILFNKKIIYFLRKNFLITLYPLFMTGLIVIMYDQFVGDNFARIFYQAFYPLIMISYYKFFDIYNNKFVLSIILFISLLLFAVEYLIFFINLNNNFVSYMVYERYTQWYSPVYISSILTLILLNYNVKKK